MFKKISLIFTIAISLLISKSFGDNSYEAFDLQINELLSLNEAAKNSGEVDKQYKEIQRIKLEIKGLNDKKFYLSEQKKELKHLQKNIIKEHENEKLSHNNLIAQKQNCEKEIKNIEKNNEQINLKIQSISQDISEIEEDIYYAKKNNHPKLIDFENKKILLTNEMNGLKNQYVTNNSLQDDLQKQLIQLDKQISNTRQLEKGELKNINSQLYTFDSNISSIDKQIDKKTAELNERQVNLIAYLSKEKQKKKSDRKHTASSNSYKKENDRVSLFLIEIKPAYFYFQDATFRHTYDNGGCLTSLEADVRLIQDLRLWAEVGYLYKSGHVKSAYNAKTNITFVPLSLGLRYFVNLPNGVHLYAKIGPNWCYCKTKQDYAYVPRKVTKKVFGATFGIGGLIYLAKDFYLDIFSSYYYDKKTFTDPTSNLRIKRYFGGNTIGLGVGYQF